MARHSRSSGKRIWSDWGDWVWSKTHHRYYQQRQDNKGVIETQWAPIYDANAHDDEDINNDRNADDDTNAEEYEYDYDNADDDEDAGGLTEQLENTHLEGEDDANDRRKGKGRAQYSSYENDGSGAEDSATIDHDPVDDDDPFLEETVDENVEEYPDHSSYGGQSGSASSPKSRTRRKKHDHYYQDADRGRYNRGDGSSSSAAKQSFDPERSEGTQTGTTADRDYIGGDTAISHSMDLDPRYRVENSNRFQPGEVFKILWPEPSGQTSTKAPTVSDMREVADRYGGRIYVGFRRFIVVANDEGNSTCVPIATYGGKGCKKRGTKPEKHGIISQKGTRTRPLEGEPRLGYPPVRMKITVEGEGLARESRVNYSKLVTVEHNVLVFFIGSIYGDDYELVKHAVNDCWEKKCFYKSKRRH